MEQKFIVYQITNKQNAKSYIGFTSKTLDQRWVQHVYSATKRNSHYRLHAAIRKYGIENFSRSVLAETIDGDYALNVLEPQFIAEFDTQNAGYNTKPGGSKRGWKHTPEALKKISLHNRWRGKDRSGELNPMFGQHHTEEAKLKVSVANQGNQYRLGTTQSEDTKQKIGDKALARYSAGFVNARRGVTLSDETKSRISEAKKGKVSFIKTYSVIFPDGHTEQVSNMAKFCRTHNLHKGNMSSVANGTLNHYKGFHCTLLNTHN
jgi:group I intron endonuclease